MKKLTIRDLILQSLIASIYFIFVVFPVFTPISFGFFQFRIAEALMILVLFNKKHVIGLTIGCFFANYFGMSHGITTMYDVIFGTFATLLGAYLMTLVRKPLFVSLLMPAITNGIIVGIVISYTFTNTIQPVYITMPVIFLSEISVLYLLGIPLYKLIEKREDIKKLLS